MKLRHYCGITGQVYVYDEGGLYDEGVLCPECGPYKTHKPLEDQTICGCYAARQDTRNKGEHCTRPIGHDGGHKFD